MRIRKHFSTLGLLLGTLFFALSLTPSLLPRGDFVQGMISGLSMVAGYGCGVFLAWLWLYLGLAAPGRRLQRVLQTLAAFFCGMLAISFLIQANDWQNSVRSLMEMPEVDQVRPWLVGGVAFAVFILGLLLAKSFRLLLGLVSFLMQRLVPRRLSNLIGLVTAFVLFWAVIDGVLFTSLLRSVDSSYQQVDALVEPEMLPPEKPVQTGSDASLLAWESLGRQGRNFVAGGPDQSDIQVFSKQRARQPVRVYVGLNAAETPEERAQLALEELQRAGGFQRSLLVLITPTGTGWIDPAAINTLEYLHRGDVASVAAQYSYLPSPVSLMAEGAYGVETARALFQAVYGYWQTLPKQQRPELYLFGLSLGALNSDLSFDFYDIIDDPFDGVLWIGPPFSSPTWQSVTRRREPDSPQWLPRFRDDSVVRFANQQGGLQTGEAPWGDFRIAFLQYASDPVTFFSPDALYREPEWMQSPRGPDVSPLLRWFPLVTMLQLAADLGAGSSPDGYGHEYAAEDYLDAWMALTRADEHRNELEIQRLRDFLQ